MSKPKWELAEWYKGCPIEQREGMQRRGYTSIYRNGYRDDKRIGNFIHHSLDNARAHIDKLHKDLGSQVELTDAEYQQFVSDNQEDYT